MQAHPRSLATTWGISVDFFSSGYLDVSVLPVRFHIPMYSGWDTLAGGFPHSDIGGSKLHCQLPPAFRRLARPSSPVIAKASTTCTLSLDPITLRSVPRAQDHSRTRACARRLRGWFKPGRRECNHTTHAAHVSSTRTAHFFHFVKDRTAFLVKTRTKQTSIRLVLTSVVEAVGIEPTTPGLQSRCSPS